MKDGFQQAVHFHNATKPSLRGCFVGFAALEAANPSYHRDPGFNPFRVSATMFCSYIEVNIDNIMQPFISGVPGFRASDYFSLSRDTCSRSSSQADEHMTVAQQKPLIGDIYLGR